MAASVNAAKGLLLIVPNLWGVWIKVCLWVWIAFCVPAVPYLFHTCSILVPYLFNTPLCSISVPYLFHSPLHGGYGLGRGGGGVVYGG